MSPLLEVTGLQVTLGEALALRGIDLRLERGESLAVIGESGAGKSTLVRALAGLVGVPQASGSIRLDGTELLGAPDRVLRGLRAERIGVVLQGAPFTPVRTLSDQVVETLRERRGRRAAADALVPLAERVGLDVEELRRYPHQVSGGQRRRAALAMALALEPDLLVLDEPTAGLDPLTAAALVQTLRGLRGRTAVLTITHALADAARLADHTVVLYAGQVLESGASTRVLGNPQHPYTWALSATSAELTRTQDLRPLRGAAPEARDIPDGCPFHPRCPQTVDRCRTSPVSLAPVAGREVACHLGGLQTVLEARAVSKSYRGRGGTTTVVDSATLRVRAGESVGVIGPSGSGKTTLARILAAHLRPDAGEIRLSGERVDRGDHRLRAQIQLVQQDPFEALSPRLAVRDLVAEPLLVDGRLEQAVPAVADALRQVGLPASPAFLRARSHELSGGQLQRIALARALLANPRVIIADEPTSMLDPSEQARLLLTLRERQLAAGLALVLVSHDLALVRRVTDHLVVIDQGRIVETGRTEDVSQHPRSATARRLLAATPALPRHRWALEQRRDLPPDRPPPADRPPPRGDRPNEGALP